MGHLEGSPSAVGWGAGGTSFSRCFIKGSPTMTSPAGKVRPRRPHGRSSKSRAPFVVTKRGASFRHLCLDPWLLRTRKKGRKGWREGGRRKEGFLKQLWLPLHIKKPPV